MTLGQFLSGVLQVWIQSFPSPRLVISPRLKKSVCPTIYPIAGGRIIGFHTFPKGISAKGNAISLVSISYDDNHCTTGTSNSLVMSLYSSTFWISLLVDKFFLELNTSFSRDLSDLILIGAYLLVKI